MPLNPAETCAKLLNDVRSARPLVHNITNWVVTNITANVTLAVGASPVMAHAVEEAADMVRCANALVLNIGTLTPDIVRAMVSAGKQANSLGIPVVLDPVGVGATPLRTDSARRILGEVRVSILRGNAAEIGILGGLGGEIKGVDSCGGTADPEILASTVAKAFGCVTAVTGPTDFVSDGRRLARVDNGHSLLTCVTGTGCMATSVTGAFAAVTGDYLWAATAALACYGLAAEIAASECAGPGSFQVALIDSIYNLTPALVCRRARVTVSD